MEALDIPIDSQVIVAHVKSESALLQDVYRIKTGMSLVFTPQRVWFPGDHFPRSPPRNDYGGIIFPTTTVMLPGDTVENFLDMRFKHRNSLTKFHYVLVEVIARVLHFRTKVIPTDNWGSPINDTDDYDGVVGYLQRGEAEISSIGLIFKRRRIEYLDFVGETVLYEGGFFFLKPTLSDVSIIYTLPFSNGVWITYAIAVFIISLALYLSMKVEGKINTNRNGYESLTYGEVLLLAIALFVKKVRIYM
ncbi:hypothetical protein L9F63_014641 [Diploptera punctata]|uniref:Ionotropic glutamate receptor L-glutamate and glycine-binding domain-containing protein n=1 Tax=Diploptera punctata TaxID=6984 RepID=A0AAD8A8Z8_DIPPU|nr:hypothetical protein L9F63_014641 [Diploptera punctata]